MKTETTLAMRSFAVRTDAAGHVAVLPVAFGACTWFSDFKRQPAIEPWEPVSQNDADTTTPPRGQPEVQCADPGHVGAAYAISHAPMPATIDSFSPIPESGAGR